MEKFEYYTLMLPTKGFWGGGGDVDVNLFSSELNRLGSDGWELVSSHATSQDFGSSKNIICIFKRKIQ